MITHIQGILEERTPASAVIDCGGVGYQLQISLTTYAQMPVKGTCRLFAHLAIREDAHVLYGFATKEERELFRQLISVSGVGSATALAILSGLDPEGLRAVIASGNVSALKAIKGVGPKTAERIIVDLRDRLGKMPLAGITVPGGHNKTHEEALSALVTLGFAKSAAEKAIAQVAAKHGEKLTVEQMVKYALSSF